MRTLWADIRSRRFARRFLTYALAAGGFFAGALGLIDVLFADPFKDWGLTGGLAIVGASLLWATVRSWPQPIEHRYLAPSAVIRVVKGDLLEQDEHIVVGMCDTFDTEPPDVIAPQSLQGQALERLWGGDLADLDLALARALTDLEPSGNIDKPGKTVRYPIGTVAAVPQAGRRVFFLAYSKMSATNVAHAEIDGIWKSLRELWAAVSRHGNGRPVCLPAIGGGQARISQFLPAQDSVRLIAFSFMLASRREKICDELRIVLRPEEYDRLDRLEIQAFLDSLEMS